MGASIDRFHFSQADFSAFDDRLQQSLVMLQDLLATPDFGKGPLSLGAELEAYLINDEGDVSATNQAVLQEMDDEQCSLELNRYNIEYNLLPVPLKGRPFENLGEQMREGLRRIQKGADAFQARVVPIGILPTLRETDLSEEAITPLTRYKVLSNALKNLRGEAFQIDIHGEEILQAQSPHLATEGANTSLQIHLRVEPDRFADTFNTLQLVSPLVLGISANSPLFLQKKLWRETRIALFKQSVDARARGDEKWKQPPRVSFGNGWIRKGAWELFAESVALHRPIAPVINTNPLMPKDGSCPEFSELKLHAGTIWPWNRAVFDHQDGGHLRIEMRALPSGPTVKDMMSSAALYIGLALGLRDRIQGALAALPFRYAEYNFYRAAQDGLQATLLWPDLQKHRLVERPLSQILGELLPFAEEGLQAGEVHRGEALKLLQVIERRLKSGMTGAQWQLNSLESLEKKSSREEACRQMLESYCRHQASGDPVAEWPVAQ